jgi:hypothetical protein
LRGFGWILYPIKSPLFSPLKLIKISTMPKHLVNYVTLLSIYIISCPVLLSTLQLNKKTETSLSLSPLLSSPLLSILLLSFPLLSHQTPKHSVRGRGRVTRNNDFVLRCIWCHSITRLFFKSTIEFAKQTCESHRFNCRFAHLLYRDEQEETKHFFFIFGYAMKCEFGLTSSNLQNFQVSS